MGGRGASSGVSDSGKPYGSEYNTVYQSGNIKFVKQVNTRFHQFLIMTIQINVQNRLI